MFTTIYIAICIAKIVSYRIFHFFCFLNVWYVHTVGSLTVLLSLGTYVPTETQTVAAVRS